jgi:gliding motility-associated-like protein
MKQFIFYLFLFFSVGLKAQVTIQADVTTGCIPLQVSFNIQPVAAWDTITTIEWNFGNWTSIKTDSSPVVTYELAGTWDVICTINGNYSITENDLINVVDCKDSLNVPNVFSPNDDNKNDYFQVKTNGINSYSFSVYTRSGNLIYKSESPTIIWDGRSLSGQKMKNGIYFYIIRRLDGGPLNEVRGIVYLFE